MRVLERIHERFGLNHRIAVLSKRVAQIVPRNAALLDIGTGDGALARAIVDVRSDLTICGVEVVPRANSRIRVDQYDGTRLPYATNSFDYALLIDVIHHAMHGALLLSEAARVARAGLLVKDHVVSGAIDRFILRFMDNVGNARYGVSLPYAYWTRAEWQAAIDQAGLQVTSWDERLRLYPFPLSLAFGRSMHFLATLARR